MAQEHDDVEAAHGSGEVPDGIRALRHARGPQQVTFAEIADHLFDYVCRHPDDTAVAHRIAQFLTDVEAIEHDHSLDPDRGLPAP